MVIIIPSQMKFAKFKDSAALYITGGHNNNDVPNGKGEDERFCEAIALADQVCTILKISCDWEKKKTTKKQTKNNQKQPHNTYLWPNLGCLRCPLSGSQPAYCVC